MSWERDPLFAKARLFFERAVEYEREDPRFGLWCAFGIELLARAALASISPTLLAEPDSDHRHLLHALGRGADRSSGKSIGAAKVFTLCKTLFENYREDEQKACMALLNRRNDELHSGGAPFDEYPTSVWLSGFYRSCFALATVLGETLETVLGKDEADIALGALEADENDTKQRVESAIAAHKKVFEAKDPSEKAKLCNDAIEEGEKLARYRHHKTTCPSCNSTALLQGDAFGKEQVSHRDGKIVVKQSVAPNSFSCSVCGLRLNGILELSVAKLSGHYTRTTYYTPEDYFGLVDLDNIDIGELAMKWLAEQGPEYDNE